MATALPVESPDTSPPDAAESAPLTMHYRTCAGCGQSKRANAYALTGAVGEDPTICRGCRGDAKRKANRERVGADAPLAMSKVRATLDERKAERNARLRDLALERDVATHTPGAAPAEKVALDVWLAEGGYGAFRAGGLIVASQGDGGFWIFTRPGGRSPGTAIPRDLVSYIAHLLCAVPLTTEIMGVTYA